MTDDETLTLSDLVDMLGDAAGLLDKVAEHLVTYRRLADNTADTMTLDQVEGFTSQAWAHARQARTILADHIATMNRLNHAQTMDLLSREARRFDREEGRGLLP